jgi:hypothetical protein
MNADLTFNSVVFKKQFDNELLSQRQSIARDINTPDQMVIRSQNYVDSTTKVAGKQFNLRIDRQDLDANLVKIITSASVTIRVPNTVTQAQLDVLVATFKAAIADASLVAAILNGEK